MSKFNRAASAIGTIAVDKPAAAPASILAGRDPKKVFEHTAAEIQAALKANAAKDKISGILEDENYATDQVPTQIWGVRAVRAPAFRFTRWYYRAASNAIVDTFLTQAEYDAANVEDRRALAHSFGTRYAAVTPLHAATPQKAAFGSSDAAIAEAEAREAANPSMTAQLAQEPKHGD